MHGFNDLSLSKKTCVKEITFLGDKTALDHIFHLESPNIHNQITEFGENIFFTGWIVGKKQSVKFIRFCTSEKIITETKVERSRPDVALNYPDFPNAEISGFLEYVKMDELSDNGEIILEAIFDDGTIVKLATIKYEKYLSKNEPDFIIIGAMKSATSAIYNYLQQHPRVIAREPKELHFFTYKIDKGWKWYSSQFVGNRKNSKGQKLLRGEASPSYLLDQSVPLAIKTNFPKVKIIVCLRNPTDRAISHYYHQFNRIGDEKRSIEQAFSEQEIEKVKSIKIKDLSHKEIEKIKIEGQDSLLTLHYLMGGQYITYLKAWLDVFPKEQILILNYHQIECEPQNFIERLFTFLELEDYLDINVRKIYENKYPETSSLIKNRLDEYYHLYNQELDGFLRTNCIDFYYPNS